MPETSTTRPAPRFSRRHLSFRLGINLATVGLVGLILILSFVTMAISSRFRTLQDDDIDQQIARVEGMFTNFKSTLGEKSTDWAVWTDTYDFMQTWDTGFNVENVNYSSMVSYDVNAVSLIRFDGAHALNEYFDFTEGARDGAMSDALAAVAMAPRIMDRARREASFQTFARVGDKLLVFAVAQVLRSDTSGAAPGYLVFGTEVSPSVIFNQLQVEAAYDFAAPVDGQNVIKRGGKIVIGVGIEDIEGTPLATIRYTIPRKMVQTGAELLVLVGGGIAGLVVVMIAAVSLRVNAVVTRPLVAMEAHVSRISQTGELTEMQDFDRNDEISALALGFNAMARQLDMLHGRLEQQSYQLGKTQNHIDVMHNVRNGLSPVCAILSRLRDDLQIPLRDDVEKALREARTPDLPPERLEKLIHFLSAVFESHDAQITENRRMAEHAGTSLADVIGAIEQNQRDVPGAEEQNVIEINGFLSATLSVARFSEAGTVAVAFDAGPPQHVCANRVLLAQVIGNVLTNAVESIEASARVDGKISVAAVADDGADVLRISIRDNGQGFGVDVQDRLFERGYSTRLSKTGGSGLHWSANTMNAMGGTLCIESPGPGLGATLLLTMPLCTAAAQCEDAAMRLAG